VIRAERPSDVVEAVRFAAEHRLRLVVRGGGHSYLGGSNAPDSLLVWTRGLRDIALHDGFTPQGSTAAPVAAVSVGAGCLWVDVYDAVTTKGGHYVQGGGCTTVGVAAWSRGEASAASPRASAWPPPACWRPRSSPPTARSTWSTPTRSPTCSGP
jgi:hypothetical protein